MPRLLVCPLSRLATTLRESRAGTVVTLMREDEPTVPALPPEVRHLRLAFSDIAAARDGHILPETSHVAALLEAGRAWDRASPFLIHCYAGVSRSTAAAYSVACALRPDLHEGKLARGLRARSPTATPNARMVALADALLGRAGRMVEAVAVLGRGAECFEGVPFSLDIQSL